MLLALVLASFHEFRVSYGSATIKLKSYVPKTKFNNLRIMFKQKGGKIFRDGGYWIWEIEIPKTI
ncbi:MAG: hypothetical protein ACTSUN_00735 [Promethearchaeota archaeon]